MFRFIQLTALISGFLSLMVTLTFLLIRPHAINWILYTVEEDASTAIYKMRPDGTRPQRLSPPGAIDSNPQWSPDGEWLIFERRSAETTSEIYIMREDGSAVQNLSRHSLPDTAPNWSPDGQTITYLSHRDGYQQIYQIRRDGTHRTNLSPTATTWGEPYWSPKGDWIIFLHWLEGLIRYDVSTGGAETILATQQTGLIESIQWAPHGRWLIINSQVDGVIYRFDPYTRELKNITPPGLFVHLLQISPDAHWLAMIAITDEHDNLVITRNDGSQPRQLASFAHLDQPQWSPDGTTLVFSAYQNNNWDIFRIQRDGMQLENLTQSPQDEREVQWSMSILLLDWQPAYWLLGSIMLLSITAWSGWRRTSRTLD